MSLPFHPDPGTIVICDYAGFKAPEMTKRRPAVIISKRIRGRDNLCTIVPLSTTEPSRVMPYHHRIYLDPQLPAPYDSMIQWVKADMLSTVSMQRLNLPAKKDINGKREYISRSVDTADFRKILECVLHAIGLSGLTPYL